MPPKFELGKIIVKEDAAFVLARAGQDADFFLAKHAAGDWGHEHPAENEQGLREGSLLWSSYRTLRGQPLVVITFLDQKETVLLCPPNSVVNYIPLADLAAWHKKERRLAEAAGSVTPCPTDGDAASAGAGPSW